MSSEENDKKYESVIQLYSITEKVFNADFVKEEEDWRVKKIKWKEGKSFVLKSFDL